MDEGSSKVDAALRLKAAMGWRSLTLLGVTITAASYYAPWSFVLKIAGGGGALIAFALTAGFYFCLTRCIAELSAAIPSSGAGQAFLTRTFGPAAGFLAGAALIVQWVGSAAALMAIAGEYMAALTGLPAWPAAAAIYGVIILVLLAGTGEMVALSLIGSLAALIGVAVFFVFAGKSATVGSTAALFDAAPEAKTIWMALPFCVTLLIGVEGVPFAAEEAIDAGRDVPRATNLTLTMLSVLGFLLLVAAPSGFGMTVATATSTPIITSLSDPSSGAPAAVVGAISAGAVAALAASMLGSVYAFSRLTFAMGRAGELPFWLTRLNRRQAPVWGILAPSAVVLTLSLSGFIDQLIILTVVSACLSYTLIFAAFIGLRRREPQLHRPFRVGSPALTVSLGLLSGCLIFSACIAQDPLWSALAGAMFAALALYRIVVSIPSRPERIRLDQPDNIAVGSESSQHPNASES
jgi:ethanolamine permease